MHVPPQSKSMYSRILVPLDCSPMAEQALPWAKTLAARLKSAVVLFHVLEPIREMVPVDSDVFKAGEQTEIIRRSALEYLDSVRKDFESVGAPVEIEIREGRAATAILEFAERVPVDLIVMATHGRSGIQRWVYGSVADKVLHGARAPLLLVRANNAPPRLQPKLTRILVPLDRSALAEAALVPARQLAEAFDAEIVLFHVWDLFGYNFGESQDSTIDEIMQATYSYAKDYLVKQTHDLQTKGLRVRWQAQSGAIAECILAAAEKDAASLIVMSTHGLSGISRWVMGSVADRVLSASPIPVLLLRSQDHS
jgi:nucleotide-binding universal stress UspA family protein